MKITTAVNAAPKVLWSLFTGRRIPLIVGWYLTYRCDRKCLFCGLSEAVGEELQTDQALTIIDRLAAAGTRVIVFSGGEPLLRDDLGELLARCKTHKITTGITTNGSLVPKMIDRLRFLDNMKISFEGPRSVHDALRGQGSYDEVIRACEIAKQKGVSVLLNSTLNASNVDFIEQIVQTAEDLGLRVKFQPVSTAHTMGRDISALLLEQNVMTKAMEKLRRLRKTSRVIANTDAGLAYMADWPHPEPVPCLGGRLFLRLDPSGRSFFCTMQRGNFSSGSVLEAGVVETMEGLKQEPCDGCWCTSTLELNLFLSKGWKRPWQIMRFFNVR